MEEVGSDTGSETAAMVVELEELEEDQPNKLYGARKNLTFNSINSAKVSPLTHSLPLSLHYPQRKGEISLLPFE